MNVLIPSETIDLVAMVRRVVSPRDKRDAAVRVVCRYFSVTPALIEGPHRYAEIVEARDALVWLLHTRLRMNASATGRFLGKNHTTILDSVRRTREALCNGDCDNIRAVSRAYDDEVSAL